MVTLESDISAIFTSKAPDRSLSPVEPQRAGEPVDHQVKDEHRLPGPAGIGHAGHVDVKEVIGIHMSAVHEVDREAQDREPLEEVGRKQEGVVVAEREPGEEILLPVHGRAGVGALVIDEDIRVGTAGQVAAAHTD